MTNWWNESKIPSKFANTLEVKLTNHTWRYITVGIRGLQILNILNVSSSREYCPVVLLNNFNEFVQNFEKLEYFFCLILMRMMRTKWCVEWSN